MDKTDQTTRDPVYDEAAGATVPTPISSFTHVGRKTPMESLVPAQPFWKFGRHKVHHRSTFR